MVGISCFGNFSMGELGNAKNLTINNLKALGPLKFEKLDAGGFPCVIPGFQPPTLPNFVIPSFPLFGGIPPFPLFCFLPPFPGIPALSLPGISIPIPPLPFIPPIPLPLPGFTIPSLPLLPSFDLGSLNFVCGLINIDLPILDPFAFLNDLANQLNGLISAVNNWLDFCKTNAEAINATQIPPSVTSSSGNPIIDPQPRGDLTGPSTNSGFLNIPTIVDGEGSQQTQTTASEQPATISFDNLNLDPKANAADLAFLLANDGQIPAIPNIINDLSQLLSGYDTIGDLTEDLVQSIVNQNNIPSADSFVGFDPNTLDNLLEQANTPQELCDLLVANQLICDFATVKKQVLEILNSVIDQAGYQTGLPTSPDPSVTALAGLSGLELAIALNSSGVPFGCPGTTVLKLTADDISRSFFIKSTTDPLTAEKITEVLVKVGALESSSENISLTNRLLNPLPEILTPQSLEEALRESVVGPSVGSLKAKCLAATRGITPTSLPEINMARQSALLQASRSFNGTTFIEKLAEVRLVDFERIFFGSGLPFPISIYDLIPILSIEFNIDDKAFVDLFTSFSVPNQFTSVEELYNFLTFVVQTISSEQSVSDTIKSCASIREGDFVFDSFVQSVSITLNKHSIEFPTNEQINIQIANALAVENNFSFTAVRDLLQDKQLENTEQLTFLLLATGQVRSSIINSQTEDAQVVLSASNNLSNPVKVLIKSPTNLVSDIDLTSINIAIDTRQSTARGIISNSRQVLIQGQSSSGSTVIITTNDFTQTLEITILRIGGFIEGLEAIDDVVVYAEYSTAVTQPEQIRQNLINITS